MCDFDLVKMYSMYVGVSVCLCVCVGGGAIRAGTMRCK